VLKFVRPIRQFLSKYVGLFVLSECLVLILVKIVRKRVLSFISVGRVRVMLDTDPYMMYVMNERNEGLRGL
jgi:hypothetical protein